MKKTSLLLCSIGMAVLLTGCGDAMPELTQEENDIITEYAVGLLLKYDKNHESRLVDLTEYEEEQDNADEEAELPKEEEVMPEEKAENPISDTEVIDASEEEAVASSIEEFYGMDGFSFQYTGCELLSEYPQAADNEADAFFAMQATPGTRLLVLKFQVTNNSAAQQELDMLGYDMKSRVSVNGEPSKRTLSTMLLNDLQTYKSVMEAGASTELVSIVEVPEDTSVDTVSMILANGSDSAELVLQ